MSAAADTPNARQLQALGAAAIAAALLTSAQVALQRGAVDMSTGLFLLFGQLGLWLAWLPLTWPIFAISRRFPIGRQKLVPVALVHLSAALGVGILYHSALAPLLLLIYGHELSRHTLSLAVFGNYAASIDEIVVVYCAVAAMAAVRRSGAHAARPSPGAVQRAGLRAAAPADRIGIPDGSGYLCRIFVRSARRSRIVDVADVERVIAADYCVRICVRGAEYMIRASLAALEERLDPGEFIRVHRSAIVRIDAVRELRRDGRRWSITLDSGASVAVSRSRLNDARRALGLLAPEP